MTPRGGARACVLTPSGRGAVAVVRAWGPGAVAVADAAFRPARGAGLAATPAGRLRLGRMGAGLGDEVVAVVVPVDDGPPEVEVHCHGGPAPLALVLDALVAAGAEVVEASAWVARSAPSRVASEALEDLAQAETLRAAEILLEQSQGALDDDCRQVARLAPSDPRAAVAAIDALLARARVGRRLVVGWRVALAGRPNVGKSRLLNALAGYDRAIVDPTPGTTRDVVTVRTAIEGWPVELADTAGLRAPADPIEAAGVALARGRHDAADLVLLVLDRSEPLTDADRALVSSLPDALLVANKADLPAAWEIPAALVVSAGRGDGLDALLAAIAARLVPEAPPPGAGVPFRDRHVEALRRARGVVERGGTLAVDPLADDA